MRHSIRRATSLSAIVLLGLGACSDDEKSDGTQPPPVETVGDTVDPGAETTIGEAPAEGVTIGDFAFQIPGPVTAGQAFTVANNDRTAHTFSDVGGAFTLRVEGDSSDELTIDAPGTYEVVCQIHASMTGTITVN
jgi:plastocyanin